MARGEIPFAVQKTNGDAAAGASCLVNLRGSGPATVFAAETGATTLANPLTTGTEGRIDGWLDEGSYDLVVSGAGITTYTQPIEVTRGDGVGRIAANAVTTAAVAAGAITYVKLAADVTTNLIPPGTIWMTAASTLPSGWVWCDGALYNGTIGTNLALWNAIGTTYGGTGQTSFAVPDLRGSTVVNADAFPSGSASSRLTANNARGQRGGLQSVILLATQMPVHSHLINDSGHVHGVNDPGHTHTSVGAHDIAGGFGTPAYSSSVSNAVTTNSSTTGISIQSNTTGISIQNAGGSSGSTLAHENMPPYQVCLHMIKL